MKDSIDRTQRTQSLQFDVLLDSYGEFCSQLSLQFVVIFRVVAEIIAVVSRPESMTQASELLQLIPGRTMTSEAHNDSTGRSTSIL